MQFLGVASYQSSIPELMLKRATLTFVFSRENCYNVINKTTLLAPGDPGCLETRIFNVKTWWLGQVTMSTGASAPRIINL
jgi:hypothetical protein